MLVASFMRFRKKLLEKQTHRQFFFEKKSNTNLFSFFDVLVHY